MSRRCEVRAPDGRWVERPTAEIKAGDVFRLFEPDGTPVPSEDDDLAPGRWRATRDAADGETEIAAEVLVESDVERQVRERGMFWPSAPSQPRAPGRLDAGRPPGRLR